MVITKTVMRGARVRDAQEQLGEGTIVASDQSEALVRWDSDTLDTWTRWNDLELIENA